MCMRIVVETNCLGLDAVNACMYVPCTGTLFRTV